MFVTTFYWSMFQAQRSEVPSGATGTSRDVRLPKKGKKRRAGVSSFRAISTRIYKFFHMDSDEQSVFYNRSGQDVEVQGAMAPEPPERNVANGRTTKRSRPVRRGESTASNRPLLDGDSVGSAGPEMRSNIYNPLLKEKGEERHSGPYDDLTMAQRQSGQIKNHEVPLQSPHDYFTLEKSKLQGSGEDSNGSQTFDMGNGKSHHGAVADTVDLENEIDKMDTILEDDENAEPPKHDYFVLEPHEKEEDETETENGVSPSKTSIKSNKSSTKSTGPGSPVKYKPEAKPRMSKSSSQKSSGSESPVSDKDSQLIKEQEKKSPEKDEEYELSKLGDAPVPPPTEPEALTTPDKVPDEYLTPKDVHKAPDYVDVLPNPPPRWSSLQAHELQNPAKSPAKTNNSNNSSPTKTNSSKSTPVRSNSPVKSSSVKSDSSVKSMTSKSSRESSPAKSVSTTNSPVKSVSSTKSSPAKSSSSTKGSPVKMPLTTTSSVTTDV